MVLQRSDCYYQRPERHEIVQSQQQREVWSHRCVESVRAISMPEFCLFD
jgi:hypothetical protein